MTGTQAEREVRVMVRAPGHLSLTEIAEMNLDTRYGTYECGDCGHGRLYRR